MLRVESAHIRAAIEEAPFQAEEQQALELRDAEPEEGLQSVAGIDAVLAVVRAAADRLRSHGTLSPEDLDQLEEVVDYCAYFNQHAVHADYPLREEGRVVEGV